MRPVTIGSVHNERVLPKPTDLASAVGNPGVHVVSSPATILFIEMACHRSVAGLFEADEGSVGIDFALRHVGAAVPGVALDVQVRLLQQNDNLLRFAAEVSQGTKLIMQGEHERAIVDLRRLIKNRKPGAERNWTFWFDVHSPWAYLAACQIGDLARKHQAKLHWRPLHLPTLVKLIDGRQPLLENSAFVRWYQQDLLDNAALLNLPISYHPQYPLRNSRALRACLFAEEHGAGEAFAQALMRGYWSESADITDLDWLGSVALGVGLDAQTVAAAAVDAKRKARLEANTREAVDRGVFGVPTVDTGSKLYFGNDRLALLDQQMILRAGESTSDPAGAS